MRGSQPILPTGDYKLKHPWQWTKKKMEVARLLTEDEMDDKDIAKLHNISTNTLLNWKKVPEFHVYVKKLLAAWEAHTMSKGIANKARRMAHLNYHFERLERIINERAERYFESVTGGGSGLIAVEVKFRKVGENYEPVEEAIFDANLSREFRAVLQQAAEESGQAISKTEISGPDGAPIGVSIGVLDGIAARVRAAREKDEDERIAGGEESNLLNA